MEACIGAHHLVASVMLGHERRFGRLSRKRFC
jgi:hypothetical protein